MFQNPLEERGGKGLQRAQYVFFFYWMPNPCLLGGPQVGGNATSPLHSRGSPKKGGQNQNWMPNPCLLGGPQVGPNATSPLHSWGSPTKGTKSKQKKRQKKQKQKLSHGVPDPTYSPAGYPHWGLNPGSAIAEALLYH